MNSNLQPESKLISLIYHLDESWDLELERDDYNSRIISIINQIISLVISMDFDSQPRSELMSLTKQAVCLFHSMDLDSQPDPLRKLISLISQEKKKKKKSESDSEFMLLIRESLRLQPQPEFISLIHQIYSHVISMLDRMINLERKLLSLITELISPRMDFWFDISLIRRIISLVSSMDFDWQPESKLLSLTTQTVSLFNTMNLDGQPYPLWKLINFTSRKISALDMKETDTDADTKSLDLVDILTNLSSLVSQTLSLEPEPKFISLIYQIFSVVISMDSKWKKLIFLCPQVQVELGKENFHLIEEVSCSSNDKWKCLPFNWKTFGLTKEDVTHIRCPTCNGENHGEHEKAPLEIKHTLHPKHPLKLVLLKGDKTSRECYCCHKDLEEVFYYCSACDYAMNTTCVEKPRVLSVEHQKWHEHTLSQFPIKTSLPCNLCSLTHSNCPFYICPPCAFVVHQKCLSLPRVIRISRHFHRIYFTPSFDQGVRYCGVCRRKIDNDYGGYSCNKDGCSYAVHSKCATQRNVWDGKELEGEPEEDIKEVEPFVTVRDGIIQHFSHQHDLKLDENTGRDYDENKLCQICITPIYFGNLYFCMQCDFILHEECAKLSRKIHHPIHPHLLALLERSDNLSLTATDSCSACPWGCIGGFFYECSERECCFKVHVQCATITEPLVHGSHKHPLFLTSKPGEERRCGVCKELGHCSTTETFNCIKCDFALCFKCATLPQKVRYKHDKHTLTLSYGEETSIMTYWCEVCEEKINPKKRFYMCDDYCCDTIHIECMLGVDLYMKPGSFWDYYVNKVRILPNNHMVRPICDSCKKRCPHKIVFQSIGSIMCSIFCVRLPYENGKREIFYGYLIRK